jgi:hypothetical protein
MHGLALQPFVIRFLELEADEAAAGSADFALLRQHIEASANSRASQSSMLAIRIAGLFGRRHPAVLREFMRASSPGRSAPSSASSARSAPGSRSRRWRA